MGEPAPEVQNAPPSAVANPGSPEVAEIQPSSTNATALPVVDLRVVLITVYENALWVVVQSLPDGRRQLPRGAPMPMRDLDAEARRIVRDNAGFSDQYIEQLYTLSTGDDCSWTIIVSYLALILPEPTLEPSSDTCWHRIDKLTALDMADRMVFDYALIRLRAKIGYTTIAFHLLPPEFSLTEIQSTYEAILGRKLDKRNFRRRLLAGEFLESTENTRREGSHRPALLYRFRDPHDAGAYLTPPWSRTGVGE